VRFGGAKHLKEEAKRAVVGLDGDRIPMVIVVVSVFWSMRRVGGEGQGGWQYHKAAHILPVSESKRERECRCKLR
jgi:hypothetical protein